MLNGKPFVVETFAGCFGWSKGWLKKGGYALGFDIEHLPHHGPVPKGADLVLQDVLTLHGAQFKDADLLLCSPPCQFFSYTSMPWKIAKKLAEEVRNDPEELERRLALFKACFRIQREAIEATRKPCRNCDAFGAARSAVGWITCPECAGSGSVTRYIPMVLENVVGAQKWVGPAKAHVGAQYLWGDVFQVGNRIHCGSPRFGASKRIKTERKAGIAAGGWFGDYRSREGRGLSAISMTGSKSKARKEASAKAAIIPEPLSDFIAESFWPL